jgi:hypothetical protein
LFQEHIQVQFSQWYAGFVVEGIPRHHYWHVFKLGLRPVDTACQQHRAACTPV